MANTLNLSWSIEMALAASNQKKDCKETHESSQQDGSYDNAVQCIDRQQNIIFPFDGFNLEPMLHQSQKQQQQSHPNKHHAGNMSGCFRHQRIPFRKPLSQAAGDLVNGNADADKTQAVSNPGIHGPLSGCPVPFFG